MNYSAESVFTDDLLVIEMNISTYNVLRRDELSSSMKYTLSLQAIFFLRHSFNASNQSSSGTLKHPEVSLMSSRKNKKTGKAAVFSDEN